jgi:hypothetical protein
MYDMIVPFSFFLNHQKVILVLDPGQKKIENTNRRKEKTQAESRRAPLDAFVG